MNGTPAPQWVQAALSWGREMTAFCNVATNVSEWNDGDHDATIERVHSDLVEATQQAVKAADAWRMAGAAPMDVANAIAALNQITRRTLVPLSERTDYTNPEAFALTAREWVPAAVEICNRIGDVELLVSEHLQTMLGGVADSFKTGVAKAIITEKLKKAGLVLVTIAFVGGLILLSRRSA